MSNLLHSARELPSHAVSQGIDLVKHHSLILKLSSHDIRLLAQIAHGAEHAIQLLVLRLHQLGLPLLLVGSVVIICAAPAGTIGGEEVVEIGRIG